MLRISAQTPAFLIKGILSVAGFSLLCSCSTVHKLPDEGANIKEVYDAHIAGGSTASENTETNMGAERKASSKASLKVREIKGSTADLSPYSRSQNNELENLFPVLPNPQLIMYVDPHLSKNGHPIPGYSVPFRLFEKDEYAMPGEMKEYGK